MTSPRCCIAPNPGTSLFCYLQSSVQAVQQATAGAPPPPPPAAAPCTTAGPSADPSAVLLCSRRHSVAVSGTPSRFIRTCLQPAPCMRSQQCRRGACLDAQNCEGARAARMAVAAVPGALSSGPAAPVPTQPHLSAATCVMSVILASQPQAAAPAGHRPSVSPLPCPPISLQALRQSVAGIHVRACADRCHDRRAS